MTSTGSRLSERTKWALTIGITLVLLIMIAAAGEIAIRVRQTVKYGAASTVENTYRIDEQSNLRVPLPNLTWGNIRTNSLGFRGPEIAVPKPAGTVRIAFLGGSTTWCAEVSGNDAAWPALVVANLRNQFPGAAIDFINGGVPGYTVASLQKNLEHRIASLEPDIIVIYEATNDMSGELREIAAARGVAADTKVQQPSLLSRWSLLWNLAEKNLRVQSAQRQVASNVNRLDVDARKLGEPFRRDLTSLVHAAKTRAKVVVLATFSTQLRPEQSAQQQLDAAASALYYVPFMTPAGLIAGYQRYNEVIAEVAHATNTVLVGDETKIPGDSVNFADTVHFLDPGSAAMAKRMTTALTGNPTIRQLLGSP